MAKSWDIQPSKPTGARATGQKRTETYAAPRRKVVRPAERSEPVKVVRPQLEARPVRRNEARGQRTQQGSRGVVSLKERRKSRRKNVLIFILSILALLCIGITVVLWQPFLRVQTIQTAGPHADELPQFVQGKLVGTRHFIFPKNSIFFVPTDEIRADILATYPDIEAVSLSASGLTSLAVTSTGRATAFWWCGTAYMPIHATCFETDTSGKIFNPIDASSTQASTSPFILFGTYDDALSPNSPLGGTIAGSHFIPDMLRFVKTIKGFGAPVTSAHIRGDEADIYTTAGTRITYVLGREEQAASLAATSFPTLDVQGSSLLYIDLRFASKIYFKKKDVGVPPDTKVR